MSETGLQGLSCPRCGGMVAIPEGQAMVICPFCEQRSVVSGERGVRRYQTPLRTTREQVMKAFQAFLSSNMAISRDAPAKAELREVLLVHLPFWSAWGRGVAWAFGQERVGSGDNVRYEPRERRAVTDLTWNGVACDVGEFGVRRIALEGRPLEPFNSESLHRSGMVFEPVGSEVEALETARQAFDQAVSEKVTLSRTSQLFSRLLNPRLGIVYYPVWVVRYLYRGRSFQVVVDGFDGAVLYGKAPGNVLYRAAMLVGGMALGAMLAIDVPAGIIAAAEDGDILGVAAIAFAAGIALMIAGWRKFRYGEHYEFHRYKDKAKSLFGSGMDLLDVKDIVKEAGRFLP